MSCRQSTEPGWVRLRLEAAAARVQPAAQWRRPWDWGRSRLRLAQRVQAQEAGHSHEAPLQG